MNAISQELARILKQIARILKPNSGSCWRNSLLLTQTALSITCLQQHVSYRYINHIYVFYDSHAVNQMTGVRFPLAAVCFFSPRIPEIRNPPTLLITWSSNYKQGCGVRIDKWHQYSVFAFYSFEHSNTLEFGCKDSAYCKEPAPWPGSKSGSDDDEFCQSYDRLRNSENKCFWKKKNIL